MRDMTGVLDDHQFRIRDHSRQLDAVGSWDDPVIVAINDQDRHAEIFQVAGHAGVVAGLCKVP